MPDGVLDVEKFALEIAPVGQRQPVLLRIADTAARA
jgi:hypothetical protein